MCPTFSWRWQSWRASRGPAARWCSSSTTRWSLRYLAKRIAGPQRISEDRTEADVYTRWDAPFTIPRLLPSNLELIEYRGVRVATPAAFVHKIPLVRDAFAYIEQKSVRSPLRYFGGFLLAVLRKHA